MTTGTRYVPGVHAARAVAVTLVLAAHIVGIWTNVKDFRWFPWQLYLGGIDLLRIDHQAGGHMGLMLFFLVSGYIVSQAAQGEARTAFIMKRAARLLPAMMLAVALAVLVGWWGLRQGGMPMFGFTADRALSGWAVLEAVGLGVTFGGIGALFVLWTLSVEFYWYAILAAVIGPAARRPVLTTWVMTVATVLLRELAPHIQGPVYLAAIHLTYVYVILVGRWIYLRHVGLTSTAMAVAGSLVALGLYGWALWPEDGREVIAGAHPRMLAVAWAALFFVVLLRLVRSGPWRPVAFFADISFGLYLFHIPVMFAVLPLMPAGQWWFGVGIAATVAVTVLLAWSSARFVETPARRAVRRMLHRRSDRPVVVTAAAGGG